ncbi:hypothetical protein BC826DRAFT_1022039 [Russula brevipes]|nr:hypothetical protein BC826DRAFT_1022039 [Russula brevipes]
MNDQQFYGPFYASHFLFLYFLTCVWLLFSFSFLGRCFGGDGIVACTTSISSSLLACAHLTASLFSKSICQTSHMPVMISPGVVGEVVAFVLSHFNKGSPYPARDPASGYQYGTCGAHGAAIHNPSTQGKKRREEEGVALLRIEKEVQMHDACRNRLPRRGLVKVGRGLGEIWRKGKGSERPLPRAVPRALAVNGPDECCTTMDRDFLGW